MKTVYIIHYLKNIRTAINSNNKSKAEEKVSKLIRLLKKDLLKKSNNIKATIIHKSDGSYNQDGQKWGRPKIKKQIRNQVLKLHDDGISYNEICRQVTYLNKNNQPKNISKAMISKIIRGKHDNH